MSLRQLLARILAVLLPLSITTTVYLYLYPVFNSCAFPLPQTAIKASEENSFLAKIQHNAVANTLLQHIRDSDSTVHKQPAIFRLLVLADPQLEGDTSLPSPDYELLPRMRSHWRAVQEAAGNLTTPALLNEDVLSNVTSGLQIFIKEDVPRSLRAVQKRVDLLGNDYYLAHIYRTLFWWTRPTHTTVLGDLLGSQWIDNDEFAWRGERYWTRVLRGGLRVDDDITRTGAVDSTVDTKERLEPLGPDTDPSWARRIINVAGNHDIGYAGDVSEARMERFEREFGRANWDIRFQHPPVVMGVNTSEGEAESGSRTVTPTLHLINLNTLNFDTPALSPELQSHSYAYLNDLISHRLYPVEDRSTFTLLLTHLPLHKKDGICTDGPYFTFHDEDDDDDVPRWLSGGLREQNHLSDHVSASGILQGIYGMSGNENAIAGGHGRKGLILTGHDHTGCDVVHYIEKAATQEDAAEEQDQAPSQRWQWAARRYDEANGREDNQATPSIREVTLRSMMGDFGGNAGLLSIWFNAESGEWDYKMMMCPVGVQHIWWAVHVVALVTLIIGLVWVVAGLVKVGESQQKRIVHLDSKTFRSKAGETDKKPPVGREASKTRRD
ncbi:hypothetical protein N7495_008376 [Penicillium taxi]|uniref:uncharacterized protein n=1 Tax=Penicillium taxi TaxID=168475 RepID=UPI0025457D10|nr:uncharacterized protein N7495_008376 [Penicillium taxi]KAJ5888335.1 hypothetical protein N7495_008376 [Penicillium taxi]